MPLRRRLRDVDSDERAQRIRAFAWSLAGLFIGVLLGAQYALRIGKPPVPYMVVFGAIMWAIAYFGTLGLASMFGKMFGSLYFHEGKTVPPKRQYSYADALLARADYEGAVRELERAAAENPDDPDPCMRLARVLRDHRNEPEEAVRWFHRASARAPSDPGVEIAALREAIEVYTHRLRTPVKALPDLARLAERYPGTPTAEWALREKAEIRSSMQANDEHREPGA